MTEYSLLGERPASLTVGGTIRGGIMVPSQQAKANGPLMRAYETAVAAGTPYQKINADLRKQFNLDGNPLYPVNTPYFVVRPGDFATPEIAGRLLDLYGEDKGEGLHLYRFPIILTVDSWLQVIPHQFSCYTARQRVYWSEYGADGTRYCLTRIPVEPDPRSRRIPKVWGGRESVLRNSNEGICEPKNCPEFRAGACKLTGQILFFVPRIPGISALQVKTTSIYSLAQIRDQLNTVAFIRGGRISGLHQGNPIFYLTKKRQTISRVDPKTGEGTRVEQILINLESTLNIAALMEDAPQIEHRASESVTMLAAPEAHKEPEKAPEAIEAPATQAASDQAHETTLAEAREAFTAHLEANKIHRDDWRHYAKLELEEDWWKSLPTLTKINAAFDADPGLMVRMVAEILEVPF